MPYPVQHPVIAISSPPGRSTRRWYAGWISCAPLTLEGPTLHDGRTRICKKYVKQC